jgi:hypothetical protein
MWNIGSIQIQAVLYKLEIYTEYVYKSETGREDQGRKKRMKDCK